MRTGPPGRALFLVGPSSAGKTSLDKVLIDVLPDPFMFFEIDRCGLTETGGRPELVTVAREEVVTRGVAYAIRGYLDAGLDLVVEAGLWHPSARAMAASVFAPYEAWLVGLHLELAELERREGRRSDGRFPGTARAQTTPAGAWALPYDLVVDVVGSTPPVAAGEVVDWLGHRTGSPGDTHYRGVGPSVRASFGGGTPTSSGSSSRSDSSAQPDAG